MLLQLSLNKLIAKYQFAIFPYNCALGITGDFFTNSLDRHANNDDSRN